MIMKPIFFSSEHTVWYYLAQNELKRFKDIACTHIEILLYVQKRT